MSDIKINVCKMVDDHVLIKVDQIMDHFISSDEYKDQLSEHISKHRNFEEVATTNGYFMSDGEVYLKDNLEAFSSIEEGCRAIGMKSMIVGGKTVISNERNGCSFDDWSDAAEAGTTIVMEEDGSGAWFIVNFYDKSFSSWKSCCDTLQFEGSHNDVLEYWLVDFWLGQRLQLKDEVIFEFKDFSNGYYVWGRCTTGQAVVMDYVIKEIHWEI